jgi:hypothetical protein
MRSGFLGGGWIGPSAFGGGGIGIPADPVPEAGAELLTNGNFAAGSSGWSASAAWSFSGGTATRTAAAANNLAQAKTLAAGTWYLLAFDLVAVSAGTIAVSPGLAVNGIAKSTPQSSLDIVRPLTISANYFYFLPSDSFAGTVDNASLKNLTLSSLLSVRPYASADCDISVAVTRTAGTQAGLCARLDSTTSPANFLIAYLDGAGNVKCDKAVAGVYTNVISGAVTYVAGQVLRLVCSGNNVSVYYNGVQIGSTTAVADAGIVSNKNHGKFSTYAANTFSGYAAA